MKTGRTGGKAERMKRYTSKTLNKIQMDLFIGLKKTNKNDINDRDIFLKL